MSLFIKRGSVSATGPIAACTFTLLAVLACALAPARADDADDGDPSGSPAHRSELVSIGHNAELGPGQSAEDVVAIFGSAYAAGDVSDSVVAVFGDARATGTVGSSVVSVFGDVSVDGKVDGDVVTVFGDLQLGPKAEVSGQVVDVLGSLERSASAVVHGGVEHVFPSALHGSHALHTWVYRGLLYGRPLAPEPELGWAWGVALGALALYVLLAVLFHDGLERCMHTLETQPGRAILMAVLAILVTPLLVLLLLVTLVGIPVVPLLLLALLSGAVFGKAAALGWLGRRVMQLFPGQPHLHIALAVLIGGAIALVLYAVPVLGFVVFALLGLLGFGAALYTVMLTAQASRTPQLQAATARAVPPAAETVMAHTSPGAQSIPSGTGPEPGSATPAEGSTPAAPPLDATSLPRAGFWIRMAALLIDVIVVGVVLSVLRDGEPARLELAGLAAYGAIMWKVKGTTVGGMVCDLKVVRLDGRPIDWGTAVARALGCVLSLIAVGLGFIWIALDPERQAWHDKIAGTVVVRVPRGTSF